MFFCDPVVLTIKATQEFTAKMKGLRKMLDGLQRLKVMDGCLTTSQLQQPRKQKEHEMEKQWKTTTARDSGIALKEISEPQNQHEVATLAYKFWQARGCPDGTPEEDWFRAEQEIATSKNMLQKEMVQKATA